MGVILTAQRIRALTPQQLQRIQSTREFVEQLQLTNRTIPVREFVEQLQQGVPVAPAPAAPADDGDSTTAAPTDDDDSSSSSAAARCLTDDEPDEG